MPQRDIGELDKQPDYGLDYTKQLSLGSTPQTVQQALPFDPATAPLPSVGFSQPEDRALPQPPPGYVPGPTSMPSMLNEDSMLYKISTVLQSFGEKVPMQMQLRMAEQEMTQTRDTNKRAWDNYYANISTMRDVQAMHNRDATKALFEVLPFMQNEISKHVDPKERASATAHYAKYAEGLQKGGADLVGLYGSNMSHVMAMQDLIADPDYGPQIQERVAAMGWYEFLKTKEGQQLSLNVQTDRFSHQAAKLPGPVQDKIRTSAESGKPMKEAEFKKHYKEHLLDELANGTIRKEGYSAALEHLNTDRGREQMTHIGIETDEMFAKRELKRKERTPEQELKDDAIEMYRNIVAQPEVFGPAKVREAQENLERFADLRAKQKDMDASPNAQFNQILMGVSSGVARTSDDLFVNPQNLKRDQAWHAQTMDILSKLRAQGAQEVKSNVPADLTGWYDVGHFGKTGQLLPLKGKIALEDLHTNPNYGKLSDKARDEIKTYNLIEQSSTSIFSAAKKAYSATGIIGKMSQAQAETALVKAAADPSLLNNQLVVLAKEYFPELAEYVSQREAVLGKFARSVSGEVGVLTDQDVGRVRNLFATVGDTPKIIAAKEKALNKLMALNKTFMREVVSGQADADVLRSNPKYRTAVDGIIGSVGTPTGKSDSKSGVNSLLDEMTKP